MKPQLHYLTMCLKQIQLYVQQIRTKMTFKSNLHTAFKSNIILKYDVTHTRILNTPQTDSS